MIYIYTNSLNESVLIHSSDILSADKLYRKAIGVDPTRTNCNIYKELNTFKEVIHEQNESYTDKRGNWVKNIVLIKKYIPCDVGEYAYVCGQHKLIKDIRIITQEENHMS